MRTIDRLEAQRVAGKIVPAVATTTSLVSGLACLELLKIASERVRRRKLAAQTSESNSVGRGSSVKDKESILSWSQSILQYLSRLFQHKHPVGSNTNTNENGIFTISSDSSVEEKERILKKFRNSFVNVARPLLAFSQPVAAETYQCGERNFSMWDTLSMPDPAESLSILTLEGELLERYGVRLQSVTFGDILLYAAFLPDAEYLSSLSLAQLIARTKSRVDNSDSGFTDTRDTNNKADDKKDKSDDDDGNDVSVDRHTDNDPLSATLDMLAQKQFIDIDITCVDEEENEIRLPTVRVKCGLTVLSSDDTDSTQDISVEPKLKYKNKQSKHVHLFESIKELALKLLASFLG